MTRTAVCSRDTRRRTGLGMTSQRARDRLIERLRSRGHPRRARARRDRAGAAPPVRRRRRWQSRAYEDTALPIGHGQTISQPWVVARMTEALLEHGVPQQGARDRHRLRLPGRGAGALIVPEVCTVERIDELLRQARMRFRQHGPRQHALASTTTAAWAGRKKRPSTRSSSPRPARDDRCRRCSSSSRRAACWSRRSGRRARRLLVRERRTEEG